LRTADRVGLFEATSHIGGAVSVAIHPTRLGAGVDYAVVQHVGAVTVGAAAVLTLRILRAELSPWGGG
jgi:hypothetical protein